MKPEASAKETVTTAPKEDLELSDEEEVLNLLKTNSPIDLNEL